MKLSIVAIMASILISTPALSKDVVAKVNGKPIYKDSFEQSYKQNKMFVSHKTVTKQTVLDDLVNRELGIQKALKLKLDQDPTVKQKMQDVLYHAMISKDLEPEFKKIKVEKSDLKKYYRDFPEYRTAHILFRTRAIPSENEAKAAFEQAWKVYNTIKNDNSKFSELANKFSQTSAAQVGGDIGYQPAIRLAKTYFQAIKGKKPGFITEPVVSPYGVHIIKVIAVKEYKDIQVPLYQKIIYDKKRDAMIEGYYKKLRKGASIQITKKYLK